MNWNDGLAGPALTIAGADQSPLRVVAGPGTGKTFTLMRRIARLLQEGEAPETIFLCSFTRTAAADLAKALGELVVDGASDVNASTLHSLCFTVLGKGDVLEVSGRVPRPMLEMEERFLIEDMKGREFGGVSDCEKRVIAFSAAWARLQHEQPGWCSDPVDKKFELALYDWLRFHKSMLIGELVPEALKFLRGNPGSPHRQNFKHILVDEFQDLNKAEQELIGMLAEKAKYSVIGDDDQSIYSFKHAYPEGILEFPKRHEGTQSEELNECRRCPTKVVEMANNLIVNNTVRSNRLLKPRAGNPEGEVKLVQWLSMTSEAQGIARFVRKKIEDREVKPGEVLILAPRRQFGYAIRDELAGKGVPVHSFFGEELFDGDFTKKGGCPAIEPYTLLCLLADPEDRVALRVWCGAGHSDFRKDTWALVRAHAEETGLSPKAVLDQVVSGQLTLPGNKVAVRGLVDRFKALTERLQEHENIRGKALFNRLFPANQAWAEPVWALEDRIGEDWKAVKVHEAVTGHIAQPELPSDVDYVRVMSLHKSKGLTAKMVVVTGCIEGIMPYVKSGLSPADEKRRTEEQRRLVYVAITRATHILMLSSVMTVPISVAKNMGVKVASTQGPDASTITTRFWQEFGPAAPKPIFGTEL